MLGSDDGYGDFDRLRYDDILRAAMSQIGVVYDPVQLSIIRLVIPNDPANLSDGTFPLASNEAQLIIDATSLLPITSDTLAAIQAKVTAIGGNGG